MGRSGQAIIQYLVIATLFIIAIAAMRPAVQRAANSLFESIADQGKQAAQSIR